MQLTTADLRRAVLRHAYAAPAPLAPALGALGFVQADPLRAPARAQDLILRQRVPGYRAGDLERRYPALDLEEGYFYAYGFLPRATWALLHPRGPEPHVPEGLAAAVLAFVRGRGPTHPRDLLAEFGERREQNAWGGQSRATTRALEHLHYWGLLRVARREQGVRVYEAARAEPATLSAAERARALALVVARLFGPLPEVSLRALVSVVLRRAVPHLGATSGAALGVASGGARGGAHLGVVAALVRGGALAQATVDGARWVWPADGALGTEPVRPRVRLLAPFDPVVWDRRRFELLWGWAYRFEAYTPVARRVRGHYALPLLWTERMVGWATVRVGADGALDVATGFEAGRPRGRAFTAALDAEVARMTEFLRVPAVRA